MPNLANPFRQKSHEFHAQFDKALSAMAERWDRLCRGEVNQLNLDLTGLEVELKAEFYDTPTMIAFRSTMEFSRTTGEG